MDSHGVDVIDQTPVELSQEAAKAFPGPGAQGFVMTHIPMALPGKRAYPVKRHRKIVRGALEGISNGAIKRLARRGGIARISKDIYKESRNALWDYLKVVVRDSAVYADSARRKTITPNDVIHALKRQGRTLYGYGD